VKASVASENLSDASAMNETWSVRRYFANQGTMVGRLSTLPTLAAYLATSLVLGAAFLNCWRPDF
jgi:hypothetical protein